MAIIYIVVLNCVRTRALRVGDGVLAINSVVLDDKTCDEVDRLLDETDLRPTTLLTVCRTVTSSSSPVAATSRLGNSTF